MRSQSNGISTIGIAFILMVSSVVLGIVYYTYGQAQTALTQKDQVVFPTENPPAQTNTGQKTAVAGGCDFLSKNPNLAGRFDNTEAESCGSLPAGSTNATALSAIQSCINNAVEKCKPTKSYIYQQAIEGSIEYLITTNNCEVFVERWGTVDPYCGSAINSCERLSSNFPDEICTSLLEDDTPLTPQQPQPSQAQTSDAFCSKVTDCSGKLSCTPKSSECASEPACISNECLCVDVC